MDSCAEQSHTCSLARRCPAPRRYCGPQLPSAQARLPQPADEVSLSMHCISRGCSLHDCRDGIFIMHSEMIKPISVPKEGNQRALHLKKFFSVIPCGAAYANLQLVLLAKTAVQTLQEAPPCCGMLAVVACMSQASLGRARSHLSAHHLSVSSSAQMAKQ